MNSDSDKVQRTKENANLDPQMYNAKFISPATDFGFKKLFGEEPNKDLLIDFLNELLGGAQAPIKSLTYLTQEQLGIIQPDIRVVFDLYCESETGEKFIVELQNYWHEISIDRMLYYSTFPIQSQAPKNDWNYELNAVYSIGIANFSINKNTNLAPNEYLHKIMLCDTKNHQVVYDKLTYIFLELPNFKKTEDELETHFEKWIYTLKNLGDLQKRPAKLQERIFSKLFDFAALANFDNAQLGSYQQSLKHYRDNLNILQSAKKEGIAIGKAKVIEEGKLESQIEMARNCIKEGMAVKLIAKLTGLSESKIESLK